MTDTTTISALIEQAAQGVSSAVVVRGPAAGWQAPPGTLVLRMTAVAEESDLPYAGLHMLLHTHLPAIAALPEPQAGALRGALGQARPAGSPDERFLIGLGLLSLLSDLAAGQPLLCVVQDAQWLDPLSASALLFAARRLHAEGVVLVFFADGTFAAPGIPEAGTRAPRMADDRIPELPGEAGDPATLAARARLSFERGHPQAAGDLLIEAATVALPEQAAQYLIRAVRIGYAAATPVPRVMELIAASALPGEHPLRRLLALAERIGGYLTGQAPADPLPSYQDIQAALRLHPIGLAEQLDVAYLVNLLYDYTEAASNAADLVAACRRDGCAGLLPEALLLSAQGLMAAARPRAAHTAVREALRLAEATDVRHVTGKLRGTGAWAAAMIGDETGCHELAAATLTEQPTGADAALAAWALCLLDIGQGRYPLALDRLTELAAQHGELAATHTAPDLAEAASRAGDPGRAVAAFTRFTEATAQHAQPTALAVVRRCRALLAADDEAEEHYTAALAHHADASQPFEQARTQLVYGEWLRRHRRKRDARRVLREALAAFERIEARAWAGRARAELRAAGEPIERTGPASPAGLLTPQELQVVQLAAAGATNREIAAQLFLSPKTVSHHLYRAFPKLGVVNRTELARIFLDI
ncbi:helix-turn-helix domain-containing protein [Longispora albida]|uniref:helix-turn-helix domain-containing protein n=1 Tax=Longispora albida TaxID=203523 RepID=UPI0012F71E3A|nr:helix-turn-helix transcriptional regulator [Longispora albida]